MANAAAAATRLLNLCRSKGYEKFLPVAEKITQHTDAVSEKHLNAIIEYVQITGDHEALTDELFPISNLPIQEKLKRVAQHCGLAMPKTVDQQSIVNNDNNSNNNNNK